MKWVLRSLKFLALLLLLAVVSLSLAGKRSGANHINSEIEVAKPAVDVWEWVNQPERLKQWVSWMVEARTDDPGRRGVGVKYTLVMRDENNGGQLMKLETTTTDYAPPNYLRLSIKADEGFDGAESYRLTDLGSGRTRVELDMRYNMANWFARLLEPLITPSAQKKMNGDIARLKQLAEEAR